MRRVILHIPGIEFDVYSYGFMIMLGFLLAMWVAASRARVVGMDPAVVVDITFWLLISGVAGSRIMFVLHFWDQVWWDAARLASQNQSTFDNLIRIVNLRDGGLEFYGGLLLAIPAGVICLRIKKVPLVPFLDLALPAVPMGLAFGRMGCFLNGCCWGKIVEAKEGIWQWLAIAYPQYENSQGLPSIPFESHLRDGLVPTGEGCPVTMEVTKRLLDANEIPHAHYQAGQELWMHTAPLIPAQLISSLGSLVIFLMLAWVWSRWHHPTRYKVEGRKTPRQGEVAAMFGIAYAILRFSLELLRSDTDPVMLESVAILGKFGLTISQVISICIMAVALPCFVLLRAGLMGKPIQLALDREAAQ